MIMSLLPVVLKEELDASGIDWDDFSDSSDCDKLEQLWDEELDPKKFSFFFDDYSSLKPAIQLKQELDLVGIEMGYFIEIEDEDRCRMEAVTRYNAMLTYNPENGITLEGRSNIITEKEPPAYTAQQPLIHRVKNVSQFYLLLP